MWHSPMFLFILLLLLSIKAALLSLPVFGDHELGVFITVGDPGNGGQAGRMAIQWPGQLLPSVTHSKSAGNKFVKRPDTADYLQNFAYPKRRHGSNHCQFYFVPFDCST